MIIQNNLKMYSVTRSKKKKNEKTIFKEKVFSFLKTFSEIRYQRAAQILMTVHVKAFAGDLHTQHNKVELRGLVSCPSFHSGVLSSTQQEEPSRVSTCVLKVASLFFIPCLWLAHSGGYERRSTVEKNARVERRFVLLRGLEECVKKTKTKHRH